MSKVLSRSNWKYSLPILLATAAFAALVSWQRLAADNPQSADEQLANDVDVTVPGTLRIAGRHTYSIDVTLASKVEETQRGPIFLVVEGTGLERLAVQDPDGMTPGDEPYFRLLAETAKLTAEKPSLTREITFKSSNGALRSSDRRAFEVKYRLTRDVSRPGNDVAQKDEQARRATRASAGFSGPRTAGRGANDGQRRRAGDDAGGDGDAIKESGGGEREPYQLKPEITEEDVVRVMNVQDDWSPRLMKIEGVIGTATGVTSEGDLVVRVFTERLGIDDLLPKDVGGIPIETAVVGRFRAMYQQAPQNKRGRAGFPNPGPSGGFGLFPPEDTTEIENPRRRFNRPVPIGISADNSTINGCNAGSIGCRLVQTLDDGTETFYALSCNHLFADLSDINDNNGLNGASLIGDPIYQPSPADVNCALRPNDIIGTLAGFVPLDLDPNVENDVDAAVALVTEDTLRTSTPDGAYGIPSSVTVAAQLGLDVQKMGRATSLTTGRVNGVNVDVRVDFGSVSLLFDRQIQIIKPEVRTRTGTTVSRTGPFARDGDSGALVVTLNGNNPVGLLFSTSGRISLANPIDRVLDRLSTALGLGDDDTLEIDDSAD